MTTELTAAQLDAQADAVLEQLEATGWKTTETQEAGTDSGQAPADAASTQAKADDANAGEQLADDENSQAKPADGLDIAALQEIANPKPIGAADPLQFSAQVPSDYKAARSALLTEESEAMERLMDGEIDAKEYAAIKTRVMDSLEELSAQRIRAETLLEANAQTAAQTQQATISALIVKAKDEVPYATDAKAQRQFDMALASVGTDPDNANKPFAHLVNEAHKVVLALRVVQGKSKEQDNAPGRTAPGIPLTLSGLPNAGSSGERSVTHVLAGLTGPDFDKAFDALPKDQQQTFLKQA